MINRTLTYVVYGIIGWCILKLIFDSFFPYWITRLLWVNLSLGVYVVAIIQFIKLIRERETPTKLRTLIFRITLTILSFITVGFLAVVSFATHNWYPDDKTATMNLLIFSAFLITVISRVIKPHKSTLALIVISDIILIITSNILVLLVNAILGLDWIIHFRILYLRSLTRRELANAKTSESTE